MNQLICGKCKQEVTIIQPYNFKTKKFIGRCGCGVKLFAPYTNHCFVSQCNGGVNSMWSKPSVNGKSYGYHCDVCGTDLKPWVKLLKERV